MKKLFTILLIAVVCQTFAQSSQKSLLINLGRDSCTGGSTSLSVIGNPLGTSSILSKCNLATAPGLSIFNVFVAYNPKDNKLYVADNSTGTTRVWTIDEGFPGSIACPVIPATPTYSYGATGFVPNNFEFDVNGDVWSFSGYSIATGQCTMSKFDVTTGTVLFTKTLQFPAGNFPSDISNGDVTILPNGRMFVVFGVAPASKLFEVTNYSSGISTATATYLHNMSRSCFSISYLNSTLELSGTNFSGSCYYYDYNINTGNLDSSATFQNGQLPVDNTDITPSVGATKRLISQTLVDPITADITYEVYAKNMGNVELTLANIKDDLGAIFGASNISSVSTSFAIGGNPAALTLNSSYNGTTVTDLLNPGQTLPNASFGGANANYVTILISCRVTNLTTSFTYYNSAIASGTIGTGSTAITVTDSSNNGDSTAIDPNNDLNASGIGEGVPTPFNLGTILPIHFINIKATPVGNSMARINWTIATPALSMGHFEIEKSIDGIYWVKMTSIPIDNKMQFAYESIDNNLNSNIALYRIKDIDLDGTYVYSNVVSVNAKGNNSVIIYPNPANRLMQINLQGESKDNRYELIDALGETLLSGVLKSQSNNGLDVSGIATGVYVLKIFMDGVVSTQIVHIFK
jgi:hypothetical protein